MDFKEIKSAIATMPDKEFSGKAIEFLNSLKDNLIEMVKIRDEEIAKLRGIIEDQHNANDPDWVGEKYVVLDARTGIAKSGKYFCLRIDANDPIERIAVRQCLQTYVNEQEKNGRTNYACNVCKFVKASTPIEEVN